MLEDTTVHVSLSELDDEHRRLVAAARQHLAEAAQQSSTKKIEKDEADALHLPHRGAFGLRVGDAETYRVLPHVLREEAARNPLLRRWRIELYGLGPNVGPVGLDICGDVVLGRGGPGNDGPDFDLTPYKAAESGVSRRHAMLRPSASKLFLIDMQSTNGTRCNSVLVSGARALSHNDTISLGNLTFEIKIIDSR